MTRRGVIGAGAGLLILAVLSFGFLRWSSPALVFTAGGMSWLAHQLRGRLVVVGRLFAPVRDLARALWPLGLPTVLVVLKGAPYWSLHRQLLIGAIAGAFTVPLITGGHRVRDRAGHALASGVLAGGVLAGVVGLVFAQDHGKGGHTAVLALVSILLWLCAAALRLMSFSATRLRLGFTLAVVAATYATLSSVALVPLDTGLPRSALVLPLLAFIGLVAWELLAPKDHWLSQPSMSVRNLQRARTLGLHLAAVSTVLLVAALMVGAGHLYDPRLPYLSVSRGLITAENPRTLPRDIRDDERLAWQYIPVLEFAKGQGWLPEPVEPYLRQATLRSPGEVDKKPGTWSTLPRSCKHDRPDCHTVSSDCASAREPCARRRPLKASSDPIGGGEEDVAYVRVVRRRGGRFPFHLAGPFAERLSILIQYWFFYPYDEWRAPVLGGELVQRHEADWEVVTVGLAPDAPLFVGYSQHCGATSERWDSGLPVVDRDLIAVGHPADRDRRTHPFISVAAGSQANYPRSRTARVPDWTSCRDIPGETIQLLSYAWNLRDRTGTDVRWVPGKLEIVHERVHPMFFPGTWGATDTTTFESGWGSQLIGEINPGRLSGSSWNFGGDPRG